MVEILFLLVEILFLLVERLFLLVKRLFLLVERLFLLGKRLFLLVERLFHETFGYALSYDFDLETIYFLFYIGNNTYHELVWMS